MTVKEENEVKKEYLKSYARTEKKIKALKEQRDSLTETMQSARAIEYSDMPRGSKQSDLSDYIVKLSDLVKKIEQSERELRQYRIGIEQGILLIANGTESRVLREHYVERKSFEEIACDMSYTYRHIIRIHGWALQNFTLPKDVLLMSYECPNRCDKIVL